MIGPELSVILIPNKITALTDSLYSTTDQSSNSFPLAHLVAALINLLHCWAGTSCSRWGSSRHATLATCCLVDLHHDGVHNAFQLLLLGLELVLLSKLVLVKPIESLLHRFLNFVFVVPFKLVFELLLLKCVPHCEAVVLEPVLCLNL